MFPRKAQEWLLYLLFIVLMSLAVPEHRGFTISLQQKDEGLESLAAFDRLLKFDADCVSPCWWGEVFGVDRISSWNRNLTNKLDGNFIDATLPASDTSSRGLHLVTEGAIDEYGFSFSLYLNSSQNIVTDLHILFVADTEESNPYLEDYSPSHLFTAYGDPAKILIRPGSRQYLGVIYENPSLFVEYFWQIEVDTSDGNYLICPDMEALKRFELRAFSPSYDLANEPISVYPGISDVASSLHVEANTEFTIENYVAELMKNPDLCIHIPIDDWIETHP